jgi:DNA-binding transcriptional LysR family regulator
MDLWQLYIFCKVVEKKSFSGAGKAIHLSQPTVSSHIKDLEAHFETQLIDRLSKKVLPTRQGEVLYGYAKQLLALRDETEAAMADILGKKKGNLTIGGSTIPGGYLLPQIIGNFCKENPQVDITLKIGDTRAIIEGILGGELELGVVGAKSEERAIIQERLIEDEMRLIVPCDHKWIERSHVRIEEVKTEPFIAREEGSGTLKSIDISLRKAGHRIDDFNLMARMGSTQAIRQGIKAGAGISILSAIAVTEDEKAGKLKSLAIEGLDLRRAFYLTRHKYRSPSPLNQEFDRYLKAAFV